jgi:hypothetical protein
MVQMEIFLSLRHCAVALVLAVATTASAQFKPVACDGVYPRHVQGVCTNGKDAIYWSWTTELVKTDVDGRVLKKVEALNHQGDLCYHDGKIYVAVNLGKFNQPAGMADSWVFVYDADSLAELSRHPVPELVHGAGGMAWNGNRFLIIGGLPPGTDENYLYEYDAQLKFVKRHVLDSGYTLMGIQTVEYADGSWWFGCYGKPTVLLRADDQFRLTGRWTFNASVGIIHLGGDRFLVAENTVEKGVGNRARLRAARADAKAGLVLEP